MPRGRTTLAVIGGWALLAISTQNLTAQTPYEDANATPQQNADANSAPGGYRESYPNATPGYGGAYGAGVPYTGMDQIRQYPHPAPEWAATHAYPNYDYPDHLFGIWFRSDAWGRTKRERCAIPPPWRPRGLGNLYARPSTPHRMDYHREVLVDPYTSYGPSYYLRQPDPNCCVHNCRGMCYKCKSRRAEGKLEECMRNSSQVRIR